MSHHYIQQDNLYFIPVIRQRVNFAFLVRCALEAVEQDEPWDPEQDLIVVGYPASIRSILYKAISLLPKLSLVIASTNNRDDLHREVFPITPADGLIEAVRLSLDRKLPLELVDREFAPGNLTHDVCIKNPNWPDDSLALILGVEKYLSMIEPYFAQPPARNEPVDS
jgi:hypothetical protein